MAKVRQTISRGLWRVRPPVLALGGGGARGFAHFGVLKAIEELGLQVAAIVGTSMGAVAGGMYLAHGSAVRADIGVPSVANGREGLDGRRGCSSNPVMRS